MDCRSLSMWLSQLSNFSLIGLTTQKIMFTQRILMSILSVLNRPGLESNVGFLEEEIIAFKIICQYFSGSSDVSNRVLNLFPSYSG